MLSRRVVNYLLLWVSYPKRLGRPSPSSGEYRDERLLTFVEDLIRAEYLERQPAFGRFPRSRGYDRFRREKRCGLTKAEALRILSWLQILRLADVPDWVADRPQKTLLLSAPSSLIGHKGKGSCDIMRSLI